MQSFEGYPSGSLVDFACDADGTPILAVSSLAEHAKVSISFIFMHPIENFGFGSNSYTLLDFLFVK